MVRMGISDAKTQLSKLIALAEAGEEVVITRSGMPAVRLVPEPRKRPISEAFGSLAGQIEIADDFDELPEELAAAFGLLAE